MPSHQRAPRKKKKWRTYLLTGAWRAFLIPPLYMERAVIVFLTQRFYPRRYFILFPIKAEARYVQSASHFATGNKGGRVPHLKVHRCLLYVHTNFLEEFHCFAVAAQLALSCHPVDSEALPRP